VDRSRAENASKQELGQSSGVVPAAASQARRTCVPRLKGPGQMRSTGALCNEPSYVAFDEEASPRPPATEDACARTSNCSTAQGGDDPVFDGRTSACSIRFSAVGSRRGWAACEAGGTCEDEQPGLGTARPGRPKLGVVARDQIYAVAAAWDWLAQQKGANRLRSPIGREARSSSGDKDRTRCAMDAAYAFMTAMAGNRAAYEDAIRARFAHGPEPLCDLDRGDWRRHPRHAIKLAYSEGGFAQRSLIPGIQNVCTRLPRTALCAIPPHTVVEQRVQALFGTINRVSISAR